MCGKRLQSNRCKLCNPDTHVAEDDMLRALPATAKGTAILAPILGAISTTAAQASFAPETA